VAELVAAFFMIHGSLEVKTLRYLTIFSRI